MTGALLYIFLSADDQDMVVVVIQAGAPYSDARGVRCLERELLLSESRLVIWIQVNPFSLSALPTSTPTHTRQLGTDFITPILNNGTFDSRILVSGPKIRLKLEANV